MKAPYTLIHPNHHDSHQVVPNYVITFIPFTHRELYYSQKNLEEALQIEKPLVVVSDAININISSHKGSPIYEAQITLLSFGVNYSSKVAVGDYVFINFTEDIETFNKVSNAALNVKALNGPHSGLKFFGRVYSVRQSLNTEPSTGKQMMRYTIHCSGFSELMTQVYYNEFLSSVQQNSPNPLLEFFVSVTEQYKELFSKMQKNARIATEDIVSFFLDVVIGEGLKDEAAQSSNNKIKATPNASFLVPSAVRSYLGLPNKKNPKAAAAQYADIIHRVFGIQTYSNSMFPDVKERVRNNYYKCHPLHGGIRPMAGNFNGVPLWQLLQRFSNPALNELYTVLRPLPDGKIVPQIVLRQIPYTSKYLKKDFKPGDVTFFLNVPRWKIDSKYPIFQYNIGTSDAERFNFIQAYSDVIDGDPQLALKLQITQQNWVLDQMNAIRDGVRVHISYSNTDAFIQNDGTAKPAEINKWAKIIGDYYVNGHLKMNGSIVLAGIVEPICHGDNLEFDNKIFHIEGVQHQFNVEPSSGKKTFLTILHISHGYYLDKDTTKYMHEMSPTTNKPKDQLLPIPTGEEHYVNDVVQVSGLGKNTK